MIEVIPAVIPNSIEEIEAKISLVKNLAKKVQLDFVDGKYAPPITWPFNLSHEPDENFKLHFCDQIILEADLFVMQPEDWIGDFLHVGIRSFVVHSDSTHYLDRCIYDVKQAGCLFGLGIKPSVETKELNRLAKKPIDFVQFMGNDKVGYNGVELDRSVLRKIADFRADHPLISIQVDIGVNEQTAPELISVGATALVSSSAVFKDGKIEENIKNLQNI